MTANMAGGIGMSIDTTRDRREPIFTQTYGPRVSYGSDWDLYTATYDWRPETTKESIWNLKSDYSKQLLLSSFPVQFKGGVHGRRQSRWGGLRGTLGSSRFVGPDRVAGVNPATGINDDNLKQFILPEPGPNPKIRGTSPWPAMDKLDLPSVNRAFAQNPGWFLETAPTRQDTSEIKEDINAAYVQGLIQIQKLSVLGGVRFEETNVEGTAAFNDPRQPATNRISRDRTYEDFFPSVHARYDLRPGWVARASYSTGMGRPRLAELYPVTTVSYAQAANGRPGTVMQNDPGLRPQYTDNIDVSLEYYFEPAGVLSVGVFRKDITDFLFRNQTEIEI